MVTEQPGAIGDTATGRSARSIGDRRTGHRRISRAAILMLVAVCVTAPPAFARDLTSAELASHLAGTPAEAAAGLQDVTTFNGLPVDIDSVLGDGTPDEVFARLQALQATSAATPVDPADARARATRILDATPITAPVPDSDGDGSWFGDRDLGVPNGLILLLFVGLGGLLAWRLAKGRLAQLAHVKDTERLAAGVMSPDEIERRAGEAERSGDFAGALRLLFQAGLRRLEERGVIDAASPLTGSELRRRIGSGVFDRLAARFDRVVYGGDAARPEDVQDARTGWATLTQGQRR